MSPKTEIVILRHPREKNNTLGTVGLIQELLPQSIIKTGLSWRGLASILGKEAKHGDWCVLYLGSKSLNVKRSINPSSNEPLLVLVDRKGVPVIDSAKSVRALKGIVLLDGNWKEAKSLWWRNAWLLKLKRGVLCPKELSAYGSARREPRRESLSTIEAAGLALSAIEGKPEYYEICRESLRTMLRVKTETVPPEPKQADSPPL